MTQRDDSLLAGDRVSWESPKKNKDGSTYREGTVLKVYPHLKNTFVVVRPDRRNHRAQHTFHILLTRLTKLPPRTEKKEEKTNA